MEDKIKNEIIKLKTLFKHLDVDIKELGCHQIMIYDNSSSYPIIPFPVFEVLVNLNYEFYVGMFNDRPTVKIYIGDT